MRHRSIALNLVSLGAMGFLYGPIVILVLYSFNAAQLSMAWRGTTLKWYAALMQDEALLAATANSLFIAVTSTIGAIGLGGFIALGMEGMSPRRQRAIEGGLILPLVIPEVMMGVALMLFFVMLKMPLGLTTVILGHIVFNIPLVAIMLRARLRKLDPALSEAAADLGAGSWQVFRYVTLPLLRPAIWGAANSGDFEWQMHALVSQLGSSHTAFYHRDFRPLPPRAWRRPRRCSGKSWSAARTCWRRRAKWPR